VDEGTDVIFDGSSSSDTPSDLPTLVYTWYFGDGSVGSGIMTSHVYSKEGSYNVTLVVTDDNGDLDSDSLVATVNDVIPLRANAGLDLNADEDESIAFDGSGSTGNIVYYNWTFGDGNYDYGFNVASSNVYTESGTYIVILNVSDSSGNWDIDTINVHVSNVKPVANAGADISSDEGDVVLFDASLSSDTPSDLPELAYVWYFGDGEVGSGKTTSHVFNNEGTYTVTLIVTDDDGAMDSDSLVVIVNDVPPEVNSPPVLESPSATTDGIFQVRYKDSNGDPPNEVLLILDGVSYEMALKEGDDFTAGVVYELDLILDSGRTYSYWFKATDSNDTIGSTSAATLTTPPEEEGIDWIFILLIILLILAIIAIIISGLSLRRKEQEKEETAVQTVPPSAAPVTPATASVENTSEAVEGGALNCSNCGAKLDPESTTCSSCGASVGPPPPPP
jgi:PKD repeat protein